MTPIADRRASSILRPSMEDDLSMIRTTHVPSGDRGGASLAGSVRSIASSTFLSFDVDVALAADDQQSPALLHVLLDRIFCGSRKSFEIPVIEDDKLIIRQLRRRHIGCMRSGRNAQTAELSADALRFRRDPETGTARAAFAT